MFFNKKCSILSKFSVLTFWAIGKIPHLKISCHSQNLSYWSNQLCRIKKKGVRWGFSVLFWTPSEPHTLVSTKMLVSSLATLHTPCQPLSFSTISKEQPLFISVIQLNPMFQPILTVTFHNETFICGSFFLLNMFVKVYVMTKIPMSHFTKINFGQSGGASWWRVCYKLV